MFLIPRPDGTITRILPVVFPTAATSTALCYKDSVINHVNRTWARLFLPKSGTKLPILVFVHGGGFVNGGGADPVHQSLCAEAAGRLGVLIVSVNYRLAPENRLPAAYDDVLEALTWVRDGKDEWVRQFGDLSRCVIVGESAGGNIVYHVGLRAADRVDDLKPLIIRGLVLIQPFFGGLTRTASELRLQDDPYLPLHLTELMWNLALPVGSNRNHEYCNSRVGGGSGLLDRVRDLQWRVGVMASDDDPLFDVNVELVKLMERKGVRVTSKIIRGKGVRHGAFITFPPNKNEMFRFVRSLGFFS